MRGNKPFLGELLLQQGLIAQEQLARALRVQAGGLRRLGYLLVRMKCITEAQLLAALSQQLGLPIVHPEEEFRPEVRRVLPRHLCHRYAVLPLAFEESNVLRLAMADPLDDVAIREVENFTGRAVLPVLASLGDVQRAVDRRMAFSPQDLFNPQVYRRVAKISAAAALTLLLAAAYLLFGELRRQREGTVSRVGDSVIYKNHDLMVDISPRGEIYFSGRGSFASGYYGVRFESAESWSRFVGAQKGLLSEEQRAWLDWLLREKLPRSVAGWGKSSG
ncbi:MAG TPA: hypothetical protein VN317_07855 [Candidatus Methanoperedens sp.]|nr:hypothetical protein [Candidatus Methanoperedens sp.]